jgi:hypothetical protein
MGAAVTHEVRSDEISRFLRQYHRAFLFCRDEAGHPMGYAMLTIGYTDGQLLFITYTKSAKVANLRARPDVACVVMSGPQSDAAWVSLQGHAEVYQPLPAEVDELVPAFSRDARVPDSVVAKVRHRLLTGKRCIIRIKPHAVVATSLASAAEVGNDETQ